MYVHNLCFSSPSSPPAFPAGPSWKAWFGVCSKHSALGLVREAQAGRTVAAAQGQAMTPCHLPQDLPRQGEDSSSRVLPRRTRAAGHWVGEVTSRGRRKRGGRSWRFLPGQCCVGSGCRSPPSIPLGLRTEWLDLLTRLCKRQMVDLL